MSRLLLSCVVAGTFSAASVFAHHTAPGRTHPRVEITKQVMADGKPLPPGTYDIWVTDQHPDLNAGAPSENQRVVQFVQNEKVVATEVAEVFPPAERPVGTSGGSGASRARAEMLRGGEFLRVSFNDPDGRFLIHLPTGSGAPQ